MRKCEPIRAGDTEQGKRDQKQKKDKRSNDEKGNIVTDAKSA